MREQECPICHNMTHEDIPKPTVRVKCGECGGEGGKWTLPCPSCTDGWNDHDIVWRQPVDEGNMTGLDKVLTLPDLIDPDVAGAYHLFDHNIRFGGGICNAAIPNNKGTLRLKNS